MSGANNNQWCTIESDPGVFTSLIESFGVKNAEFSEIWSLDDDSLASLGSRVYGLIFLFKWQSKESINSDNVCLTGDNSPEGLYFAKQVTTNACATQAILSVLMNVNDAKEGAGDQDDSDKLVLGKDLSALKQFSASFPPDLRGHTISGSEEIRLAHNSFARNDSFLSEPRYKAAEDNDDVFHFIAYVPHTDNNVYELDGLQEGPICHGKFNNDNTLSWLHVARNAIQKRIERYAASEIKFNLMAVVQDKRISLNQMLNAHTNKNDDGIMTIRAQLLAEEEKRNAWETENQRRRHNYLPFCLEFIKTLVREDKLQDVLDKAAAATKNNN